MVRKIREISHLLAGAVLACGLASCGLLESTAPDAPPDDPTPDATPATIAEAERRLADAAKKDRDRFKRMTFQQFKSTVYREPFEGGKYIVNGDTPILNDKQLQEFFNTKVQGKPEARSDFSPGTLVVNQIGGQDTIWNSAQSRQLTYCVSRSFGDGYAQVVSSMEAAAKAWGSVAGVNFFHVASQDNNCTARNQTVVFDVRPVSVDGAYLARAFFPNEPRASRNVLIDDSALRLRATSSLTLVGVLRHELGHTLGFRHEHTRPSAGTCFEDSNWRPLTNYDPFSVMHYPQCNGRGDWSLTLTDVDESGTACLYGPAPGFQIDTTICAPPESASSPCPPDTREFAQQRIGAGEIKQYGAFSAAPGTLFEAQLQGNGEAGDPDLYVRFGSAPTRQLYDCRPYLAGAEESCSVDVPTGQSQAFVMVYGFAAGSYDLTITRIPAR